MGQDGVPLHSGIAGRFRKPPPPPLPDGWVEVATAEGEPYYWQEDTGVTCWDRPMPEYARRETFYRQSAAAAGAGGAGAAGGGKREVVKEDDESY